ncbi:MAG: hypothetical protein ACKO8Z_11825 [Prosthecobacter sp.]
MHKPAQGLVTWLELPTDALMASEIVPAAEWFVISTLVTLFFLLGCFATLMWVIWRRTVNPPPHVRLLMEMAEEEGKLETKAAGRGNEDVRDAWERDSDWWRDGKEQLGDS